MNPNRLSRVFCLIFLVLGTGAAGAGEIPVYPGCDAPEAEGRTFYVDPARGSPANDGTQARPWRTLAEVLDTKSGALAPGGALRAGDTLALMSGDHGDVDLHNAVSERYISVVAAPGQAPVVRSLKIGAASHWLFRGLAFRGGKAEGEAHKFEPLVGLGLTYRGFGPTRNLVFIDNSIATDDDADNWRPADWVEKPRLYGLQSVAECVALVNNRFFNLRNALGLFGERTLVQGNLIERFGNDGIDFAASRTILSENVLRDSRYTPTEPLHPDAIQGWSVKDQVNREVVIERNRILNLNPDDDNMMQGVSLFSGRWDGLSVVNNLVITNAWHGIALYGVEHAEVVNNTVLPARPDRFTTWITVQDSRDGRASKQTIVRNNIAATYVVAGADVSFDHNISLLPQKSRAAGTRPAAETQAHNSVHADALAHFVNYDPRRGRFDLRPDRVSPAREAGTEDGAPGVDIDGRKRTPPVDIGAFAR